MSKSDPKLCFSSYLIQYLNTTKFSVLSEFFIISDFVYRMSSRINGSPMTNFNFVYLNVIFLKPNTPSGVYGESTGVIHFNCASQDV